MSTEITTKVVKVQVWPFAEKLAAYQREMSLNEARLKSLPGGPDGVAGRRFRVCLRETVAPHAWMALGYCGRLVA